MNSKTRYLFEYMIKYRPRYSQRNLNQERKYWIVISNHPELYKIYDEETEYPLFRFVDYLGLRCDFFDFKDKESKVRYYTNAKMSKWIFTRPGCWHTDMLSADEKYLFFEHIIKSGLLVCDKKRYVGIPEPKSYKVALPLKTLKHAVEFFSEDAMRLYLNLYQMYTYRNYDIENRHVEPYVLNFNDTKDVYYDVFTRKPDWGDCQRMFYLKTMVEKFNEYGVADIAMERGEDGYNYIVRSVDTELECFDGHGAFVGTLDSFNSSTNQYRS